MVVLPFMHFTRSETVLGSMATILLIDDELQETGIVRRRLLEGEGYHVVEATTGKEALRQFRSHKVDLVLLDYWMAGMNGIAVAREIKSISPTVPMVMLSGFAELPGEGDGIVDKWILKGRSTEVLLTAIRELLQKAPRPTV